MTSAPARRAVGDSATAMRGGAPSFSHPLIPAAFADFAAANWSAATLN